MDFYETLKNFKPYEIEASKRITNLNNTALLKFCDNYKYDFITTPDMLKFEVKMDAMSLKTNNIVKHCVSLNKSLSFCYRFY